MSEIVHRAVARLLPSLSLANLLALQLWLVLFRSGHAFQPTGAKLLGAVVAVLLIAGALWSLAWLVDLPWSQNAKTHIAALGLAVVWGVIFWGAVKPSIQQSLQYAMGVAKPFVLSASAIGVICLLGALWRFPAQSARVMHLGALVLVPFVGVTFYNAITLASQRGLSAEYSPADPVPSLKADATRQRTVVLLFDEFDYELAFESKLKPIALPVLQGLKSTSLFATHAYPPMHSTMMSVPAMLTGKLVKDSVARDQHPGDLLLQHEDEVGVAFSEQDTLFTELRRAGYTSLRMNDALLPPKRLPGPADADTVVPVPVSAIATVSDHAKAHLASLAVVVPFAKSIALDAKIGKLFGLPPASVHVSQVVDRMVELAADGGADLLFLHVLLPHLPVVFDPASGKFGPDASSDYRDNFAAVDLTIGKILDALRANGRLANTNIMILSDHFFRQKRAVYGVGDHRIPFIVQFGRDTDPVGIFDQPFNTVLFRPMVMEMVQGRIKDSKSLAVWIAHNAQFGESPLLEYRKGW